MTSESQKRANKKQDEGRVSHTFHVKRSDNPEAAQKLENQKGNKEFQKQFINWIISRW